MCCKTIAAYGLNWVRIISTCIGSLAALRTFLNMFEIENWTKADLAGHFVISCLQCCKALQLTTEVVGEELTRLADYAIQLLNQLHSALLGQHGLANSIVYAIGVRITTATLGLHLG